MELQTQHQKGLQKQEKLEEIRWSYAKKQISRAMTESMKSKYGFQIDMACTDMEKTSAILGDLPLWRYISRPTKM
eukprot:13425685-Ditylum_brightwellii.AAC.1